MTGTPRRRARRGLGRYAIWVTALTVLLLGGGYAVLGQDGGRAGSSPSAAADGTAAVRTPEPTRARTLPTTRPQAVPIAPFRKEMRLVRAALEHGVAHAHRLDGRAQVAVWVDGWPAPLAFGDDLRKPMRMWSMAKPVEAIAAISRAADEHVHLTAGFSVALRRALQRSENCSARRMVLELQGLTGGTRGAREAFAAVLRAAGVEPIVATQEDGPSEQSPDCEAFLQRHQDGLAVADGTAVLFGTSHWTVTDAVRFAHALADERYGSANDVVLNMLAEPKKLSEEPGATFTADPRWGAGLAFHGYPLAYKAGWGGTRQGAFLAGQFAIVTVHRRRIAVAAMFHPNVQPQIDDPGETRAPLALQEILTAVADTFPRLARTP